MTIKCSRFTFLVTTFFENHQYCIWMVAHNELQSWQRQFLANISTKSANGHNAFKEYLNKTEKYFNHSVGCRGSSCSHFIPILDNLRDIPFYFICHHFTKLVNWFTPEFWDLIVFCFFYFQFFGCLETNFGLLTKHPLSHLMLISVADFRLEGHWEPRNEIKPCLHQTGFGQAAF